MGDTDFLESLLALDELAPMRSISGEIEFLPTRIKDLDTVLGGGVPIGKITEIFGTEDSCKSAIGYNLLKSTIDREGLAVLIDTEDRYSPQWWSNWGLNSETTYIKDVDIPSASYLPTAIGTKKELDSLTDLAKQIKKFSSATNLVVSKIKADTWYITQHGIGGKKFFIVQDKEKSTYELYLCPNFKVIMPNRFEDSLEVIDALFKIALDHGDTYTTIILDSYEGVPSKRIATTKMSSLLNNPIALKARMFAPAITKLTAMYNEFKIEHGKNSRLTFVVVNHAKTAISSNKTVSTGGRQFKHSQYCRILTRKGVSIKPDGKKSGGFFISATIERNKAVPIHEGARATFKFYQPSEETNTPAHFEGFNSDDNKVMRNRIPKSIMDSLNLDYGEGT